MSTKVRTNRIEYCLNKQSISEKYDFFTIETSEKYIKGGAYILDSAELDKGIRAIRYDRGRRLTLMMLHSETNKIALKKLIDGVKGGDVLSIIPLSVESLSDDVLIQLLLNAVSCYETKLLSFNNLTGHLYCFHEKWVRHGKTKNEDIVWSIPCLEISVTKDFLMNISVRTFTSVRLKNKISFKKKRFEEYPQYIMGAKKTLRRKLTGDNDAAFILRQIDGHKTDIPFMDIQSIERFHTTKAGVVNTIVSEFNEKYSGLAHIDLGTSEVDKSIDYSKSSSKENKAVICNLLSDRGLNIVDLIQDSYSKSFCESIADIYTAKYALKANIGKRMKKEALNICVIHNAAYYEGMNDPHDKEYENVAVQHVTLEDFNGNSEFALSTVIHEVLIKKDIKEGKISLFDWTTCGLDGDITFGMEDMADDMEHFYIMTIHPDGTFIIKEQENNLFEMNEYSDFYDIFETAKVSGETVKGIIRDTQGNINIIKDTGLITYPESEAIVALLKDGDNRLRGKERREELLSSCLDIKMLKEESGSSYFVGTIGEGMRWSIPRAANIRHIEPYKDSKLLFDKLLPLMNVTFVHNGQLTVLPFPFKYLREYVNNIKRVIE